jgi:hypothetical protein
MQYRGAGIIQLAADPRIYVWLDDSQEFCHWVNLFISDFHGREPSREIMMQSNVHDGNPFVNAAGETITWPPQVYEELITAYQLLRAIDLSTVMVQLHRAYGLADDVETLARHVGEDGAIRLVNAVKYLNLATPS